MSIIQEALKKAQGGAPLAPKPVGGPAPGAMMGRRSIEIKQEFKTPAGKRRFAQTFLLVAAFSLLIVVALKQFPWETRHFVAELSQEPEIVAEPYTTVDIFHKAKTYTQARSVPSLRASAKTEFPNFILNGIMEFAEGPRAVINNSIVSVGDSVDGATVAKIEKKNVVLKLNGSEISLELK